MVSLHMDLAGESRVETPWYAAYPAPKSVPDSLSASDFLQWLQNGKRAGKDFILVDLRRTDCEVSSSDFGFFQGVDQIRAV